MLPEYLNVFLIFILEYRKNYSGPKNTNEVREA